MADSAPAWWAEAHRLRATGMLVGDIAARLGKNERTVRDALKSRPQPPRPVSLRPDPWDAP